MKRYPQKVVLITGMSGAGKTTALRCFEDLGYFCVDNVPPQLIETFLQLMAQMHANPQGAAFVCDVRSGALFDNLLQAFDLLKKKVEAPALVFLDCTDAKLIARYNELRRQHPLASTGLSNEEAIREERRKLQPLRGLATEVIDTTELTARQLTQNLREIFGGVERGHAPMVSLVSFGYKYGAPLDADFVFDTRFLPNPYYVEEFKYLDGTDRKVYDFVLADELAPWYGREIIEIIEKTLPGFQDIQKLNVQVAIGCTGGKHRSVALVEWLKLEFEKRGIKVTTTHRDIDKP